MLTTVPNAISRVLKLDPLRFFKSFQAAFQLIVQEVFLRRV